MSFPSNWIFFSSVTDDSCTTYITGVFRLVGGLEVGGRIFPTEPHPEGGQLYSPAGAPPESSLLAVHPLTSLGGPSHFLAPVSHAKSPAGQGRPTGHVQDVVGVQLRELAFSGITSSSPQLEGSAGPVPPRSAVEHGEEQTSQWASVAWGGWTRQAFTSMSSNQHRKWLSTPISSSLTCTLPRQIRGEASYHNGSLQGGSPTLEWILLVVKEAGNGLDGPGNPTPHS